MVRSATCMKNSGYAIALSITSGWPWTNITRSITTPALAKIYENIGSIHEDQERYDSAARFFRQALALNQQNGDSIACLEIYKNLGDVFRKTGHYQEGLHQTRNALALALRVNEQYQICSAYRDIWLNLIT